MSDGPHRSLPLPPCWKRVAEIAYEPASPAEDLRTVYEHALIKTLKEPVTYWLVGRVLPFPREPVEGESGPMAGQTHTEALGLLEDHYDSGLESGLSETDAVGHAIENALREFGGRHILQIDEHCTVNGIPDWASEARGRLERLDAEFDYSHIAGRLADSEGQIAVPKVAKKAGLEEGPPLP